MHLTHELILLIQITRGRRDFNRDFIGKSSCWCCVMNLQPSDPVVILYLNLLYWLRPLCGLSSQAPTGCKYAGDLIAAVVDIVSFTVGSTSSVVAVHLRD